MKIVIDIDDKVYGLLKYFEKSLGLDDKKDGEDVKTALMRAVIHGTPLPEHHGRLGDLDVLEAEMINGIKAGNYEDGYEEYAHINDMDDCVECVKYAPTIIEGSESK